MSQQTIPKRDRARDTENLDDTSKRPRVTETVEEIGTALCNVCQRLDLDWSFESCFQLYESIKRYEVGRKEVLHEAKDGTHFYDDAVFVHRFGNRLAMPTTCPLCQFFKSLRIQPESYDRYKLLAFRSSKSWLFQANRLQNSFAGTDLERRLTDTIFMAVVPDKECLYDSAYDVTWLDYEIPDVGSIFLQPIEDPEEEGNNNRLLGAIELQPQYDVERAKTWLNSCRNEHGKACKGSGSPEPISRGFRLIDCTRTPPVIEEKPWGTEYVALSYVWGTRAEDRIDWPQTVLDAIQVTKDLGLSYLWVDRCCINQDDPIEKSYLISRMTTIYEAAEFTIVAAAGAGASDGLPGVKDTPRASQPKYFLDSGNLLLSICRDPRRAILASEHWTRGWCYQEGVLSNRKIVFTEQQTYWECRCMAMQESADISLFHMPAPHDESISVMADFMLTGIFKGGAFSGGSSASQDDLVIARDETYRVDYGFSADYEVSLAAQLRGLNEHIREFSKRKLTQDTDSLLAFQGIVGLYQRTQHLHLVNGMPIWTGNIPGSDSSAKMTFALSVASWYHGACENHDMFVSEPCRRRTHLPSWTWAGWNGTVSWRAPPNLEHCAYMNDLIRTSEPSLIWAANIHVSHPGRELSVRILEADSVARLLDNSSATIEIKDAFVLNQFVRVEETGRNWTWQKAVGRRGREQFTEQSAGWDKSYWRIGKRLSFIGMSISMTPREWTDQHAAGTLVSVLVFTGRYHDNEHGTARFLTLRRVSASPERWERVGTLYLVIPFLGSCRNSAGLFHKIPASRRNKSYTIQ